jgi:hypothetical protein
LRVGGGGGVRGGVTGDVDALGDTLLATARECGCRHVAHFSGWKRFATCCLQPHVTHDMVATTQNDLLAESLDCYR